MEHWQKTFVMLSKFWPLREWGDLGESVKKGKFMTKIFFQIGNVNWSSKELSKMISADVKQQEIKELVVVSFNL